ncbi:hypothetical protein [Lysobacter sp. CFH 32150]|uniref:tetratricopeptide repeat protein n=1 Tax=Lysobacter sp. CFH 32150 TaxID=2927128 RepID=UPI001FA6BB64|nr:hypothetical protein [Lysobacter sp. CFH 32150]MCI4566654.1 hypothetical protein [Lysobacter sp. CFH 32150]
MRSFFAELKRRNVFGAMAFYLAAGWLLVQVATQVLPFYDVPGWVVRLVIAAVVIGFPFALVLSWFYEWTPRGWRREIENDRSESKKFVGSIATDQSIAVLPFVDMSEDQDQEYFSDGLSEELLNLLAQLPQLRVIARTSSFSFKGKAADVATIARALNVATVLEGSVRKSGNTLRITAQLIRAVDSSHLWSQTYDRELVDVFQVQDGIANAVVAALKVKLLSSQQVTNAHRTGNTEAYDQYLLGQNVFRRGRYDDYQRALVAFERATALDPGYGAAQAALASAQSAVADFAPGAAARSAGKLEALATAERAITLAPDLADGYVIRGRLRMAQFWDWNGAEADFQKALALEPNKSDVLIMHALVLNNLQRTDEAVATLRRAIDADPLSWLAWMLWGAVLGRLGCADEGRVGFERALEISPDSSFTRHEFGCLELVQGRTKEALAHFRLAGAAFSQSGIAMAEYTLGHERESQAALAELESKYATGFLFQIAQVHAWRGDKDAAFEWLERACAERDTGIARIRGDLLLDRIKDDPRYTALVRKIGFPQ